MPNTSIMRVAVGENKYKELNSDYPLIEGYLLQKLDEILILSTLTGLKYKTHYSAFHPCRILDLNLSPGVSVEVVLCNNTKRIGIKILVSSKINKQTDIYDQIQKKFNLHYSNRHMWNSDYNFKYNHRNCQKIIDVIKFLLSLELE